MDTHYSASDYDTFVRETRRMALIWQQNSFSGSHNVNDEDDCRGLYSHAKQGKSEQQRMVKLARGAVFQEQYEKRILNQPVDHVAIARLCMQQTEIARKKALLSGRHKRTIKTCKKKKRSKAGTTESKKKQSTKEKYSKKYDTEKHPSKKHQSSRQQTRKNFSTVQDETQKRPPIPIFRVFRKNQKTLVASC